MTDTLGWRKVFAVVGPSTNTTVQPEYEAMRPAGVTFHYRAFLTEDPPEVNDAMFTSAVAAMGEGLQGALRQARSCRPDGVILGISILSFAGGLAGAEALQRELDAEAGVPVTLGSFALVAALRATSPAVRRIALLTPYWPAANALVRRFLEDAGFDVRRDVALKAPSWTGIARLPPERVRAELLALDGDDVDAIVQVGTNLPMLALGAEAERALGKPVIPVNVATCWHALRTHGVDDPIPACSLGQAR
jgi:maleate isomerase